MLEGLQTEIDAHPEFIGASRKIIMAALNADGSANTETWAVIPLEDQHIKISRLALLTKLTADQRAGIRAMLNGTSDAEQDFAMLFLADDEYWVNDLTFRSMVDTLAVSLSISDETVTAIKRLGERQISRAEELWERKLTMEDFE